MLLLKKVEHVLNETGEFFMFGRLSFDLIWENPTLKFVTFEKVAIDMARRGVWKRVVEK